MMAYLDLRTQNGGPRINYLGGSIVGYPNPQNSGAYPKTMGMWAIIWVLWRSGYGRLADPWKVIRL